MKPSQIVAFKRNPTDPLKPIAVRAEERPSPPTRDSNGGAFAPRRLLHRLVGATSASSRLADQLGAADPALLQAIRDAQSAPNRDAYKAAFGIFNERASTILHEIETGRRRTKLDAGLYTLLAPVYSMQTVLEQIVIEPQLVNLLPKRTLGTSLEHGVYLEYVPGSQVAETSWEYGADGPVAAGQMTPRTIRLVPFRTGVMVSAREREVHDELRGKMGAPAWDLFSKRMEGAMRDAMTRMSQLASYGDPNAGVYGLLSDTTESGITAANVNFDSGVGLTDADTIIAQIALQADAVGYSPSLVADTVVFDALSWYRLTGRGVSNTGDSDGNVIGRVFAFRPEIQEITYALECGPTTAVTTALTPKVGATEAARLRGGYNDSGTTKRCMVILKNDPEVLEVMEGLPISYEALDDRDGAIRGMVRGSCGGLRAYRKEAIRICYL